MSTDDGYREPINPVQLETAVDRVRDHIARGVRHVSDAEARATTAAREFDRAYARAFLAHHGPQTEKRYAAELDPAVVAARDERDVADLAFRHARRQAEALRDELSAYQSITKSVLALYGSETGVGR